MICLSRDELVEISGYRQRSAVSKWLRTNGFVFRVAADGWPRVDRVHFHALMGTTRTGARNEFMRRHDR